LKRTQWTLLAATLLLAGGFYAFVYRPQVAQATQLKSQIQQTRADLTASQSKTSVLPSVDQEVQRLRDRVSKFKSLPQQKDLGQFLLSMEQLAKQTNLKLNIGETVTPGLIRPTGKINSKTLDLSFEGDFVSIYSFLRSTEDFERLTLVPSISVKAKDRSGQVKVAMKMNIYFQAE
jgi:Tfp pilus assembly protein PilO